MAPFDNARASGAAPNALVSRIWADKALCLLAQIWRTGVWSLHGKKKCGAVENLRPTATDKWTSRTNRYSFSPSSLVSPHLSRTSMAAIVLSSTARPAPPDSQWSRREFLAAETRNPLPLPYIYFEAPGRGVTSHYPTWSIAPSQFGLVGYLLVCNGHGSWSWVFAYRMFG
jgi:hypothetical protein